MPEEMYLTLGDALQVGLDTAMSDWRREHAPSVALDELLAGPVLNVALNAVLEPAGRCNVSITVSGRRRSDTDVYFLVLQRKRNLWTFPHDDFSQPPG